MSVFAKVWPYGLRQRRSNFCRYCPIAVSKMGARPEACQGDGRERGGKHRAAGLAGNAPEHPLRHLATAVLMPGWTQLAVIEPEASSASASLGA